MCNLNNFISMVENHEFIEAHKVLEGLWKELKKTDKEESQIVKGLINGATALALKVKGKDEGAIRVWSTFEKYRPLIATVSSQRSQYYKRAEVILNAKYKVIF